MMMWQRFIALVLVVDVVLTVAYLVVANCAVVRHRSSDKSLVAEVFFADYDAERGVGAETLERLQYAEELYRLGAVENILCVGGWRGDRGLSGAQQMVNLLIANNISLDDVFLDNGSFDTTTNLSAVDAVLKEQGWGSVRLVSSALHLFRIQYLVRGMFSAVSDPTLSVMAQLVRDPFGMWGSVHREWLAWSVMLLLPKDMYHDLVLQWRLKWY